MSAQVTSTTSSRYDRILGTETTVTFTAWCSCGFSASESASSYATNVDTAGASSAAQQAANNHNQQCTGG